ncbi:MAG: hypothetical protein E4G90_01795 [Gemmatimonadales bacterium]|jgi:hypothetical protein|nr:MAG: hypothetical protein E4G90_01795 [Gemmatimonadales bacterium]
MRRALLSWSLVWVVACAKSEVPPAMEAPAAPTIDLASLAGTWAAAATPQGSDSVVIRYTVNVSADPTGWTSVLPGRDPMSLTVKVSGDSILTQSPPFESVARPGVQVSSSGYLRLVDGKLTGPMYVRSATGDSVSVVNLWTTLTRVE